MKKLFLAALTAACCISCNNSAQDSTGNHPDSASGYRDTLNDSRGTRGTGSDLNGGTPGPGTITDTFRGKTDTADQTSKKSKD